MSSVKVLKEYALEIGIPEKEWDQGVNKAINIMGLSLTMQKLKNVMLF